MSTAARVAQLFEAQKAHRWTLAQTTAAQRVARLRQFEKAVVARRDELAEALFQDFGKAAAEVEITELRPFIAELDHLCEHLAVWMKRESKSTPLLLAGTQSFVKYEPKGVVLILAPWNYPFGLLMTPFIAAAAAGNCVMMRPSNKTAHTGRFMAQLIADTFPPEEAVLVNGGTDVADALLDLPFDHIFFTGSPRVGRRIMEKAAKHLTPVTLELGGKSPAVVDGSTDIVKAARRISWAKFINAGQTCVAPDHVWVHESVVPRYLAEVRTAVGAMYGADETARARSPDFARIIDESAYKRLADLIQTAREQGARVELGGTGDPASRYLAPTVLSAVTTTMPVMREEIFGPIMPVLTYRTIDEVAEFVNSRGKPLAMYLFGNGETVEAMLARTSAGGTVIGNALVHLANPHLPFGGVGESGMGNYHGQYGFRTFSHERAVLRQGRVSLAGWFYPPYGERMKKTIARAMSPRR